MYQLRLRMNIQSYSDRPHVNTCIYSVNGLQNPYSHLDNTHVFNPSKPFVITALNMLIIGSMIGSIWMMTIYGVILPAEFISMVVLFLVKTMKMLVVLPSRSLFLTVFQINSWLLFSKNLCI